MTGVPFEPITGCGVPGEATIGVPLGPITGTAAVAGVPDPGTPGERMGVPSGPIVVGALVAGNPFGATGSPFGPTAMAPLVLRFPPEAPL
jgi:hypothetical protein